MGGDHRCTHDFPHRASVEVAPLPGGEPDQITFGDNAHRPIPVQDHDATDIAVPHQTKGLGNHGILGHGNDRRGQDVYQLPFFHGETLLITAEKIYFFVPASGQESGIFLNTAQLLTIFMPQIPCTCTTFGPMEQGMGCSFRRLGTTEEKMPGRSTRF